MIKRHLIPTRNKQIREMCHLLHNKCRYKSRMLIYATLAQKFNLDEESIRKITKGIFPEIKKHRRK